MNANYQQLLTALSHLAEFARQVGAKDQAATFAKLQARLQADRRSSKSLEEEVFKARGLASFWIPQHISKQPWNTERKEQSEEEFARLRQAVDDALFPPKPPAVPETDIQGLAGNAEYTRVLGDPRAARPIARRAMDAVQRFSSAVFRQDIETAYSLCANELRTWMSVKRFLTDLERADQAYGGSAVACKIERITCIEADDLARQKTGNKQGNWPKDTPKPNKRAIIGAFWYTHPAENRGRWVMFWVTEEAQGYRIAKFNQYLQ